MRSVRAFEILGGRLKTEDDVDIRALCLFGVVESQPTRRKTEFLIDALTDPDPDIRTIAWAALEKQRSVPRIYDPGLGLAARAQAVADLHRWARASGR